MLSWEPAAAVTVFATDRTHTLSGVACGRAPACAQHSSSGVHALPPLPPTHVINRESITRTVSQSHQIVWLAGRAGTHVAVGASRHSLRKLALWHGRLGTHT